MTKAFPAWIIGILYACYYLHQTPPWVVALLLQYPQLWEIACKLHVICLY